MDEGGVGVRRSVFRIFEIKLYMVEERRKERKRWAGQGKRRVHKDGDCVYGYGIGIWCYGDAHEISVTTVYGLLCKQCI